MTDIVGYNNCLCIYNKCTCIQGYGTNFYSEDEYYEGEWYADKRSGWGRMYYADGSIYEGEWYGDKRNGKGLLRVSNGNRYEGSWSNDMKNGPGKFYYLDKGQVYVGNWVDDIAKCGTLEDFGREGAPDPPVYPIPEVRLTLILTTILIVWRHLKTCVDA